MTTLPSGETQQIPDPKSPAEVQQEPRERGLHQVQAAAGGDQDISGRETVNIPSSLSREQFEAVTLIKKSINQDSRNTYTNNTNYNTTYYIFISRYTITLYLNMHLSLSVSIIIRK